MSLCGMKFHAYCTSCVNTEKVNAGCEGFWSCRPIQLQTDLGISQCVWDNHASLPVVIGYCTPDHDSTCGSSVSRPQPTSMQAFLWHPYDQHTSITGTRTESSFIRKHNRFSLHPPISSRLTPQASQKPLTWSQRNTPYRAPGLKLSLKKPFSNSSLCYCGTNYCVNFGRRSNTMRHSRTPNTAIVPLRSATYPPGT
ncbi:uncharacterized protein TNCV_784161 [Trichonephila clavipes]|nr:uncharacterized protein TNCV_784161 [Trichonephila clavipes]